MCSSNMSAENSEGANLGILFSSDFLVKIVDVTDSSQQMTLRGHDAPVLSVAFDPSDEFLVGIMVTQGCC